MKRPPIVTVLGHVDHGKTSLLDALRNTNVAGGESGGITQHTGASQINYDNKKITFIDTPGHEAFSQMRQRGGKVADIAVLVVAANDGVKPQTVEAISHAKAANIPIIVALNKIDLPDLNKEKVKKELYDNGLVLEEFGGDVICVEVSATKKLNLDKLLESIAVVSELIENTSDKNDPLKGFVLESVHNPKKGYTASIILTAGVLNVGDEIAVGSGESFKVRSIFTAEGSVEKIEAGDSGEVLGLKSIAEPGDLVVSGDKKEDLQKQSSEAEKEDIDDENIGINVVLRADTRGTLEAIVASLQKLQYEGKRVNILLADVGEVKESDILLASVSKGIVLSFKNKVSSKIKDRAETLKVLIREYNVIYELIDEVKGALEGVFELQEEKVKGRAEILKVFPLPSGDVVAGCLVTHGRLRTGDSVKVYDPIEETELLKTKIKTLKKQNEKVDLIGKETECGLLLNSGHNILKPGLTLDVL